MAQVIAKQNGVRLTCVCGNTWVYSGNKHTYATCPDCRKLVRIPEKKRKSLPDRVGTQSQTATAEAVLRGVND